MPVEFIDLAEAMNAPGLRMVVVSGVPSPWGEAAKGLFHIKRIPWKAVRLDPANAEMCAWIQTKSGPAAMYEAEAPRSGWAEILLLAERLAPEPSLLPTDASERARVIGISHEICGEAGLGWVRRLQGIHAGLQGQPGFPIPVAEYLANKYGYRADDEHNYTRRVVELLDMLAGILRKQDSKGSRFYCGASLTALDIYSATFMALFKPLPVEDCPMAEALRPGFESLNDATAKALDPILLEHRDFLYNEYLELPLTL